MLFFSADTPAHPSPPKSQLPPSTNGQVLRREQRVGLHRSPHPEQTGPDHAAHSLDLLWQKFCEALGGSGPACSREASLVERLQRLSQLIHSMGGLQGEQSRGERGGHGTEPQRRVWASREDRAEEALQGADSVQSLLSWSSSLVHTEGTETPSPGSDSSIDTQRLIWVYGAHRVQKMKNGAIHRQKRGVTHRTTPPSAPPPLGPTEDRVRGLPALTLLALLKSAESWKHVFFICFPGVCATPSLLHLRGEEQRHPSRSVDLGVEVGGAKSDQDHRPT